MPTPTRLGLVIRRAREAKGWTQGQLARAAGITDNTLERIEQGATLSPGLGTAGKIADALGLSVDALWAELRADLA